MAKRKKSSKKPTTNQTSKVLASIPIETMEKAINEKKILLLNVKDENQKVSCAESIDRLIVDPRNILTQKQYEDFSGLKTIDCLILEKKEILEELDKVERLKYFSFDTHYIKDLRKSDYDNTVAVKLRKLRNKIKGKGKRKSYIKLITSKLGKINKTLEEADGLSYSTILIRKVKECDDVNIKTESLAEEDKNEIEKYTNDVPIEKIIEGIKLRKNEKYKLIMESTSLPPALIISFLNGEVPDEFLQEFKKELKKIKVKSKHTRVKNGGLKEGGKSRYIHDEDLEEFLKGIEKEGKKLSAPKLANIAISEIKIAEKNQDKTKMKWIFKNSKGEKVYGYKKSQFAKLFRCIRKTGKLHPDVK